MVRFIEIFMIIAYCLVGVLLLFTDFLLGYINTYREVWGGVILLYAVYRGTLLRKKILLEKHLDSQNKRT